MNNRPKITKLSNSRSQSDFVKRSILTDLVLYEHVETTITKAKAVLPLFDKLINTAKDENKRSAEAKLGAVLYGENAVNKAMEVLAKRLEKDKGGYIQVYKLGRRKGDNAEIVKMIVKGYTYKEVGAKTKSKKQAKKEAKVEQDTNKFEVQNVVDAKGGKSQVAVASNQGKAKSRSGI